MRVIASLVAVLLACVLLSAPQVNALGGCDATPPTTPWSVALTFIIAKSTIQPSDTTFASSVVNAFANTLSSGIGVSREDVAAATSCGSANPYDFADSALSWTNRNSYQVTLYIDHSALKSAIDSLTAPAAASQFISIMKSHDYSTSFLSGWTILVDSLTLGYINQQ